MGRGGELEGPLEAQRRRDLSQLSDEQKAKLQMLGIDPAVPAAQQQGPTAPQGIPTEAEFEQQKKRILGG